MSNIEADEKILGLIPKGRYVYFMYTFLLVSAAGNAFFSILSIIGLNFESATYGLMVLGLMSFILAILGFTKCKDDFSAHDHAHFKYAAILFPVFFVIFLVFGGVYGISYFLGYLCTAAIGAAQAVLVWTGYNSWQDGRVITKENIKDEIKLAIAKR